MATLTVPPVPPSPRDDALQLYRAFKGTLFLSSKFLVMLLNIPSKVCALIR